MSPTKIILFILGTFTILFGLTFLSTEGEGTESDHIDLGIFSLKYPTTGKFLNLESQEKKDLKSLKNTFARLANSEAELDSMMKAMRGDSSFNKMDTSLTGLQVAGG